MNRIAGPIASSAIASISVPALAANAGVSTEWLTWVILTAIAIVVVGILLRMLLAARFPKGYRTWARERRNAFAERNDKWDHEDEAFRK